MSAGDVTLTQAEWERIACCCETDVLCPIHDEDADSNIEFNTVDLYTRITEVLAARTPAATGDDLRDRVTALADEWQRKWDEGQSMRDFGGGAEPVQRFRRLNDAAADLHAVLAAAPAPVVSRPEAVVKAEALRDAADDWDRSDQPHLTFLADLAREKYTAGGPSMPAIWLRARATSLASDSDAP